MIVSTDEIFKFKSILSEEGMKVGPIVLRVFAVFDKFLLKLALIYLSLVRIRNFAEW